MKFSEILRSIPPISFSILKARIRVLTVAFVLVLACSTKASECSPCAESRGVKVTMRDGKVISGYLLWGSFFEEGSESFDDWLLKLNAKIIRTGWGRKFEEQHLRIYTEIAKLRYPRITYVTIREKIRELKLTDIRKVEPDSGFPLRLEMMGADMLSQADAALLSSQTPLVLISQSYKYYLVYENKISLVDLLLWIEGQSSEPWLAVNGKSFRVQEGEGNKLLVSIGGTSYPFDPSGNGGKDSQPVSVALDQEFGQTVGNQIAAFIRRHRAYSAVWKSEIRPCRKKVSDYGNQIGTLAASDPRKAELQAILEREDASCKDKELAIKKQFSIPTGDDADLRRLGVVTITLGGG